MEELGGSEVKVEWRNGKLPIRIRSLKAYFPINSETHFEAVERHVGVKGNVARWEFSEFSVTIQRFPPFGIQVERRKFKGKRRQSNLSEK